MRQLALRKPLPPAPSLNLNWEQKTWEFTAVDTITVLEFHPEARCWMT